MGFATLNTRCLRVQRGRRTQDRVILKSQDWLVRSQSARATKTRFIFRFRSINKWACWRVNANVKIRMSSAISAISKQIAMVDDVTFFCGGDWTLDAMLQFGKLPKHKQYSSA